MTLPTVRQVSIPAADDYVVRVIPRRELGADELGVQTTELQGATLPAGSLGPGSVAVGVADYLAGSLPNITALGEIYPDDSTDNAAVFAAALASGRRYFVPPGLYRCNSALTPTSGSGLIGLPGQTKIIRGGGTHHMINFDTTSAAIVDVVLSGIYLDGKVGTYSNGNYHTIFSAGSANALSRITIENCEFVDTAGGAVLLLTTAASGTSGRINILSNKFSNIGYQPINLQGNGGVASTTGFVDCQIKGNQIEDWSMTTVDAPAITLARGGARNVVIGNLCRQVNAPANGSVAAHCISTEGTDVTVAGNVCEGAYGYGIEVGFSDRVAVSGNTCRLNNKAGIAVSGFEGSDSYSVDVTISGNVCTGNYHGIYVFINDEISNSITNWHENIAIVGNGCHRNDHHGILAFAVKRLLVSGNATHQNGESGILVGYPGSTAAIYTRANRDLFVNGNAAFANNGAASASYAGIQIFAASSITDSNTGSAYGINFAHNNGSGDVQTFLDNVLNPLSGTTLRTQANRWTPVRPGSWIGDSNTPTSSMDMYPNLLVPNIIKYAPVASSISSNPTPSMASGSYHVYTVSAAVQIQLPSNSSVNQEIVITIIQGGSGGYAITWVSGYKFNAAWSDTGNTTGKIAQATFRQVASNVWLQVGTQSLYA